MVNVSELPDGDYSKQHIADFSIMPTLKCNLQCPFCMYDYTKCVESINLDSLSKFLETVDWSLVPGMGLYGGEPSIALPLYQLVLDMLPKHIPKVVISNGVWSNSKNATEEFIKFCQKNGLIVYVSETWYHKKFQDRKVLERLAFEKLIFLKGEDIIHPMGRAAYDNWTCTKKCLWHKKPSRIAIYPSGHIILQNCDGVYPIIGHMNDTSFCKCLHKVIAIRTKTCNQTQNNVNNLTGT